MIIWLRNRAKVYLHLLITKYLTKIGNNMKLFKLLNIF